MFKYGITESLADYWCHITPRDHGIYIYRRVWMLDRMDKYPIKEISTAIGHVVPCVGIPFFKCGFVFKDVVFSGDKRRRGEIAENVLAHAVKIGCLWWRPDTILRATLTGQFQGMDMMLQREKITLECKLDEPGGINGTGNLFVQTHERHAS